MAKSNVPSPSASSNSAAQPRRPAASTPASGAVVNVERKPTAAPSDDAIRVRAYELYCRRQAQGTPGSAQGDWEAARAELAGR